MKKLIAIILSITLIFSFMAMPAAAKVGNVGDSDPSYAGSAAVSIFDKIADFFHDLIAKIFGIFGADCPICDNHYGYGDAEGEGGYNKAEAAKMYNDAINKLKKHNKTLRIDHTKDISAQVADVPAAVSSVINNVMKDITGRTESGKDFTYNEQAKINSLIPPTDRDSALNGANVEYISVNKINDTTKIEFELIDDEARYDGTSTSGDEVYASVLNPINLGTIDLGTITVTEADISYKDVKVVAVLNNYGNVISLKTVTNFEIRVTAKAMINFTTNVEGTITEEFEITY